MTPTEAPPETAPDALPPDQRSEEQSAYGVNNRDLPEQLVNALKESVRRAQKQDTYLRRREVMRDRKNRFYERGYQHIYWTGGGNGGFALMVPGQVSASATVQTPRYIDDYNIFWPYERIQLSILTQHIPNVEWEPDTSAPEDLEAANAAECYDKFYDRANNTKGIHTEALRMMLLSGRAVTWTRTEQDEQRWGLNDQGEPRSMETTTVYGSLESRVPIMSKCQDDALYCFLYEDPQVTKAKADYSWIADKIRSNAAGIGENQYERLARLGALQGSRMYSASGESFSYLTTKMECFLRPECFAEDFYDVAMEDEPATTVQDKMLELFPQGVRVTFLGETYAESFAECLDDHIKISFAIEGDGMFRLAPMDLIVVNQDAFNDAKNVERLIYDVGWPSRWVTADQVEFDALAGEQSTPYALRLKKASTSLKAEDQFYQEEQPTVNETFVRYYEDMGGPLSQFQTATPPSIWGAETPDNKTAAGQAQAKSSAMGQLGMLWQSSQEMWAAIRYQAALAASSNPDHPEEFLVPSKDGEGTSINFAALRKGKFRCFPDQDSSFPESTDAKRATFTAVMTQLVQAQSPVALEIMNEPENVYEYLRINGLSDIIIPQSEARQVQRLIIEQLLQQSPMRDPMQVQEAATAYQQQAQVTPGLPPFDVKSVPPSAPSIAPNDWDYHEWYAQESQSWLNSISCQRELAKGNTEGVTNVDLNRKAHLAMIPPPPMLPPSPAAPKPQPVVNGPGPGAPNPSPGAPGGATL